jgi:hypothetical protein
MPIVFMPMDAMGKIRTQDMLKLAPMKLDARRFIKSSKGKLGKMVIDTSRESSWKHLRKAQSDTKEYGLWLQKRYGSRDIEKKWKIRIVNQKQIISRWLWTLKKYKTLVLL